MLLGANSMKVSGDTSVCFLYNWYSKR